MGMTRKEAKSYIGELKMYANSQGWDEEYQIACDVTMNALEQEPTTKNNLEVDTISRADAIRVASGYCHPSNVAKELTKLPPVNAIQLPDNATNGNAILAVFPNTEHYKNNGIINTDIDDGTLFNEDWWDASYKRDSVDKK